MILTQGSTQVVSDVHDDMTNGESGTDTTLFNHTQTGVIAAIAATDIAVEDKTLSVASINITYLLSTALANGEDVAEFEINNGSIAFNRILKAVRTKSSQDEFNVLHTFDFVVVI
jgi:hypothetical protein